jgi:hypothetical protein
MRRIDNNISTAKTNVIMGNEELVEAKIKHKQKNKCLISFAICAGVTVLIASLSLIIKLI